jgi:hypothetical protein
MCQGATALRIKDRPSQVAPQAPASLPASAPWPIANAKVSPQASWANLTPSSSLSTPFGSYHSASSHGAISTSPTPTPPPCLPVTDGHIDRMASRYLRGRLTPNGCARAEKEFAQATRLSLVDLDLPNDVSNQRIAKINALLRHFPGLTHLRITLRLKDIEIPKLQLKCLPHLLRLDLSKNLLTGEEFSHLALDCVPNLLHLDLSDNFLEDDSMQKIQLECLPRLTTLRLAGNYLTATTLQHLRFESIPLLRCLDLRRNVLRAHDVARLPNERVPSLQKILVETDSCMRPNIAAVLDASGPPKSLI